MALAMESSMPPAQDTDLMDIDIDMDMDDNVAAIDDEYQLEEGEEPSFVPSSHAPVQDTSALIPAIYTEDPALEPQWNKIHIRGVDDFHTNDILGFVHDHFSDVGDDVHTQWIDDTSANICFKDNEKAKRAHLLFLANPITEVELTNAPFEIRSAKPLASRPGSMLVVRVAQQGDRKRKNAKDASRYYLLHPNQDPTERMRTEFANTRGDYRRREFDDRELHRRRRDKDANADPTDFSANMYDDAPAASTDTETAGRGRDLFSRVTKGRGRGRSASPSRRTRNSDEIDISDSEGETNTRRRGYRDRNDRGGGRSNVGKELFSSGSNRKGGGGLQSDKIELFPSRASDGDTSMVAEPANAGSRPFSDPANSRANAAAAKRLKADLLSAAQTSPRSHHRRSHAMDAKNAEDLSERFARKSISIDSTKSFNNGTNSGVELFPSDTSTNGRGLSIKGSGGLSIKGRAQVKELFPNQYERGSRMDKKADLFDAPVRENRVRRRAGDLFD